MNLTQSQIGIRLADVHPNGRSGRPFERSYIAHLEAGDYEMSKHTQQAYARALAECVAAETKGALLIKMNSKWQIEMYRRCEICHRHFRLKRITQYRCGRHRR